MRNFFTFLLTAAMFVQANTTLLAQEKRAVSGYKGVSNAGPLDVVIDIDGKEGLTIDADDDLIKDIETVVENGVLKIKYKTKNWGNWNNKKGTVYVSAKKLDRVSNSGSGNTSIKGALKATELMISQSGSGNFTANVDAGSLNVSISGSGNSTLTGKATNANIKISGSGNFNGKSLNTNNADVALSGSGNIYIMAEETVNARTSGSGSVKVGGNAKLNSVKSGSGSISKM